eukprot:TRINITY_DN15248_c0_g1_i6.p1 TRINITY_DN15248_c0_g1~~TRINITY_DN15248_c0_g1_i6.p1  ORF type:complete len:103 (-),score=4.87 TRINITY_DN15248_c0_g1_i6:14-322(-)
MARIPRDNRSSDDRTVVCGWRGCRRIPGVVVVHSLLPIPPVRHSLPHRGPGDADLIPDPVMLPRHPGAIISVSYTHLTLPTKRIVEISVGGGSFKKKKSDQD